MLRSTLVIIALLVLGTNALRGPFEALLLYLWIAYFRPDSWLWDASILTTIKLSFSVGVYLFLRTIPRLAGVPVGLRGGLLIMFFVISCLSAWTSDVSVWAWERWIDFGTTLVISYILYVLASESFEKLRTAIVAIAFSLGFEAVKQGYFGLILRPGGSNQNELPNLGDNNGVAVGMLMLATLFIALSRTATGNWAAWEKRLHMFMLLGVLYRAITTYSRGAFLALGVMTIVYILRSNHKFKAALGATLIASILLPSLPQRFWNRMSTMTVSSEDEMDTSSASRIHFWRVAVRMANDQPLLGIGYNSYQRLYNRYDFSVGFYGKSRAAHSMWFGVLADLGYPALFMYIMMFVLAFVGMGKVARYAKAGDLPMNYYHIAVALQAGLVAAAVGGSFLPFQYIEMLWHFIALTMAMRQLALKQLQAKTPVAAHEFRSPLMRTA